MPPTDDMKTVKIQVPSEFDLPPFYSDASPAKRALALRLGAEAAQVLQKRAMDSVRQETHAEAVRQATQEFEAQLADQAAESAAATAKLRTHAARTEEALKAAQLRLEALETQISATRQEAQKEARESLKELLTAKDEQIRQLQATLERQMESMTSKLEGLQMSLTKTTSSSKEKGTFGESFIENLLKRAFDCDVQGTAKDRETADIRVTRATGAAYFWEIKNYTRMVSREEVAKLKRDLGLHPDVRGGILVSLRQGIVDHTRGGDIDLEFLEDGRFVLYISNFNAREDPVFFLQTLRPFFDTIESLSRPMKEDAELVRALEAKALLVTNLLRSHADTVTKHKNVLVGHKRRSDAMFTEFQGLILEAESQVATLLRVTLGGDEAIAKAQTESETMLSRFVFKKERLSDCTDEKGREFVKWLLTQAEAREGTQIEIKELVDRARPAGFAERRIKDLREELFQESAWSKGSRYLLGLRWLEVAAPSPAPAPTH